MDLSSLQCMRRMGWVEHKPTPGETPLAIQWKSKPGTRESPTKVPDIPCHYLLPGPYYLVVRLTNWSSKDNSARAGAKLNWTVWFGTSLMKGYCYQLLYLQNKIIGLDRCIKNPFKRIFKYMYLNVSKVDTCFSKMYFYSCSHLRTKPVALFTYLTNRPIVRGFLFFPMTLFSSRAAVLFLQQVVVTI